MIIPGAQICEAMSSFFIICVKFMVSEKFKAKHQPFSNSNLIKQKKNVNTVF